MKQTTRLLAFGALMLCSGGAAMAQNDLLLVANPTEGGQEQTVPVFVGSTVKFTPQGIEVNGDKTASFNWGTFTTLSFKNNPVSVGEILTNGDLRLRRNPAESVLEFAGHNGKASTLYITDLKGARHITHNDWNGENVDVTSLSPGVYFVTINSKTLKFIKK